MYTSWLLKTNMLYYLSRVRYKLLIHRIKIQFFQFNMYSMHHLSVISPLAKIPTPCAWQLNLSIFGWVYEAVSTSTAREPLLCRLRKYDARCCIIFTEGYRSGHNEAVLKICSREFLQRLKIPCYAWCFRTHDEA